MKTTKTTQAPMPLSWTLDDGVACIMDAKDHILFRSEMPHKESMDLASRLVLCHTACATLPDPAVVPELVGALRALQESIEFAVDDGATGFDVNSRELIEARAILARCGKTHLAV